MAFVDVQGRLEHMLDAIEWTERLTAGKTIVDYRRERPTRDAVERNLERISEASRHLPDTLKATHPLIAWSDLAKLGNRLRHGYDTIDDALIWNMVEHELPALRHAVEQMLTTVKGN